MNERGVPGFDKHFMACSSLSQFKMLCPLHSHFYTSLSKCDHSELIENDQYLHTLSMADVFVLYAGTRKRESSERCIQGEIVLLSLLLVWKLPIQN